ncbi:MAG: hypothetical protein E7555_04715 [Ruminococcaceae bacterium]|nr:hypothetical protein [Oscillospiraceae bacterium]
MENERDTATEKQTLKDKLMAIILLETAKDYKEMDSDLVTECVDFLMELEGKERLSRKEIEQRVNDIPFKGRVTALSSYAKRRIRAKRLAIIAAVLAVIIALFGMFAIASGNTLDEIFREIGSYLWEMSDGSSIEYNDITFIKADETKKYSSFEELAESEEIDILYPTWLPDNEKIVEVWCLNENDSERYVMYCNIPEHNVEVTMDSGLSEKAKSNCLRKEIAGHLVYYEKNLRFVQANFVYENNLYLVTSDTEDNLFRIIENLKEIN